jgi:hypothetical protein
MCSILSDQTLSDTRGNLFGRLQKAKTLAKQSIAFQTAKEPNSSKTKKKVYFQMETKSSLLHLADFERNSENVIIDPRYNCESHDSRLMKQLLKAKHQSEILEILAQMRNEHKFCDVIFVVSGRQYLAHKSLISLYSPKYK